MGMLSQAAKSVQLITSGNLPCFDAVQLIAVSKAIRNKKRSYFTYPIARLTTQIGFDWAGIG